MYSKHIDMKTQSIGHIMQQAKARQLYPFIHTKTAISGHICGVCHPLDQAELLVERKLFG